MKKFLFLIAVIVALTATTAQAGEYYKPKKVVKKYYNTTNVTNVTNVEQETKNSFGAKLDAPYLVELRESWYLGAEGGKDLFNTDLNDGWYSYGKITYTGTLFSFKKDK